jgi:ABC-type Na+ transport system ATPase subunit NatA
VETDITEDTVRDVALPRGLVDNKVCAIDETWSGLRLVFRRELRDEVRRRRRAATDPGSP